MEPMFRADSHLSRLCEDALREAGEVSAAQEDVIRADLELRFEHAGKYVAYIDHYRVRNKISRLTPRSSRL